MADLDEAAVNLPSNDATAHLEVDLSDETHDFRMLNHLSSLSDNSQVTLPKRGEKDFEPNPTLFQADILSASRQAMHTALSYPRLHNPKQRVIGIYAPNGPAPPASLKSLDAVAEDSPVTDPITTAVGVPADSCVYVTNPKGQFFKTMGQADRWNRVWLLPEEALYLLERGSLDLRWPCSAVGSGDEDNTEDSGIPMSLQAAYACFIGPGGLTIDQFSVFTGLRRLGYTLIRAPGWSGAAADTKPQEDSYSSGLAKRQGPGLVGIFTRFLKWLRDSSPSTVMGPVAGLGFHHSYTILTCSNRRYLSQACNNPILRPCYAFVSFPTSRIALCCGSAPPSPDFRVAVVNARTHTTMPTLSQLGTLLESTPFDPPQSDKQLYVRLRHGYRNVILAVVDQGVQKYSHTFSRTIPLRFSRTQRPVIASENLPVERRETGTPFHHSSDRLSGRTCMITGGSSGIGFAIAQRFLQEGAVRIILVGRSYARLVNAAILLGGHAPESIPVIQSYDNTSDIVATRTPEEDQNQGQDLTSNRFINPGTLIDSSDRVSLLVGDISEAASWSRELENAMKNVDILVNAAGISVSSVLPKTDPKDISQILRTNLEGSLLTSRALLRASIRNRMKNRSTPSPSDPPPRSSKCIINISSLLALKGGTGAVPYAASKAGILGLTRSLTVEAASSLRDQPIRSNVIVPGYIETPMIADFSDRESSKLKEDIPLRRFGQPQEVADAAVFLAQNEYANNCVINLDGGLSAL
ncbi:hypothetical protein P175DRAFT_0513492 [Aspergillus ochraceoroseus IBT 24754]|uniref:tRNA-splicing endonuclease subunit Sen54 N-terminal domain-containing protein n=1 Tax=Aspergillus ochraceoroseus IBT 24754 TaxID=1392256 RepID=A0A2T5M7M6_9EURO|nr:uncharacterized protein P175DRAFT_0513492 [Aspergillus ochraceoroseus IBT 24754]PTU24535.1 hypothetical protein P175DRAFT_0513492 [Aspergillus ochraceoroseus IBT 24754]